jgi:hypothetical protein
VLETNGHSSAIEASGTIEHRRIVGGKSFENVTTDASVELWVIG